MINHRLSNKSKLNSKSSPKPLREFKEPATPAVKLKLLKLRGFMSQMANPTNMELGISTQMPMDGSRNTINQHPAPSSRFFKSYKLNKGIKLNTQSAKKDKQLSEAKQQVLNFARISIHVEELGRSFVQSTKPTESKKVSLLKRLTAVPKIFSGLPLAMLKSGEIPEGSVLLRRSNTSSIPKPLKKIQFKANSQKQPIASDCHQQQTANKQLQTQQQSVYRSRIQVVDKDSEQ
ncbi:hypothetical protein BB559_003152 [Furculomyces boomerangus]|uniref:Uncharacterized protein n=1 Tax=Furculomyces boomerangus TaxID=61424 RepID=A0A2T9YNE0_9FUNG|nr:hypothetical protein BB559_003152 [Furculomyces boomerangus]